MQHILIVEDDLDIQDLLNSFKAKGEFHLSVCIQQIFRMGVCSPAIITADSHLVFGYAYYCVMNLWEFIWMHGIFHLMWSVWECREHH